MDELNSTIYEALVDKVCKLFSMHEDASETTLLETACTSLDVDLAVFYMEDTVRLGAYICQIVFNENIFINAVSGSSQMKAYQNAAKTFLNLCLIKRNLKLTCIEINPDSFYNEIKESIDGIELSKVVKEKSLNVLIDFLKENEYLPTLNIIYYEDIKKKLKESGLIFTEVYCFIKENLVTCSILVNGILLLQQCYGCDNNEALTNTISSFFALYEIIPKHLLNNIPMPNGILNKNEILLQLKNLFNVKKHEANASSNYWDIIQECAKALHFNIIVNCGEVKINDIVIIDSKEKNEYVANIIAGKKLVELLTTIKENRNKVPILCQSQISTKPPVMNFPKSTKIYNQLEIEKVLKVIAINTNEEFQQKKGQSLWTYFNNECLNANFKVELNYLLNVKEHICIFVYQGSNLVFGTGSDRSSAREVAVINLLDKYLC